MPMMVKKSCPECKSVLEGWHTDFRKFGMPLVVCENCRTVIKKDNVNEWELMSIFQRIDFIGSLIITIIALTIGLCILLALISYVLIGGDQLFIYKNPIPPSEIFTNFTLLSYAIFVVSIVSISIYEGIKFIREIDKSKERLKDVKYRNLLRSYGLIKKNV